MKKAIGLSIGALALIAVIGLGIWFLNARNEMQTEDKSLFIPYNSAFIVTVHAHPQGPAKVIEAWEKEQVNFQGKFLAEVVDSLRSGASAAAYPYVLAARVEGKSDVTFLYVIDQAEVWSRGEMISYLNRTFAGGEEKMRKYDRYRIYELNKGKERVYFTVCGSIVLVSDSDLYIEDGLKQFDLEATGQESSGRFRDVSKYFSTGAEVNILMNTEMFTEFLPLYFQMEKWFPNTDARPFFKWGTLDGDFAEGGISLNGFMHYDGLDKSYFRTLAEQEPGEISVDKALPGNVVSVGLLHLNRLSDYFSALEDYRYSIGRKDKVNARKRQYAKMFGKNFEPELRELLLGEFALAGLPANNDRREGLVVAALKSGSLGKGWLDKLLADYATHSGKSLTDYTQHYALDNEKTFTYYEFPASDFPQICWGEIFGGLESRYAFVEGNYLVFATSRDAVETFLEDYVHGSVLRESEWYADLRGKLAGKCNLAYFACTDEFLTSRRYLMQETTRQFVAKHAKTLSLLPSFALQWSNEEQMLYQTVYLSSLPVRRTARPHVLWRTRLEAPVTMKPVAVTNHVTGEQEMFVQDSACHVYLINDAGRVLWTYPLGEPINSEVYQVDLYKNGKLQYLFSTPSKIYLIDRNGNAAGNFPLTLRSKCTQGITLYDYDDNKDYRIFVPADDQRVYLYDLNAKIVQGWMPARTDKPLVTPVRHFRVEGKDYLVFADRYRLYILDRRGKERVSVNTIFDLPNATDIMMVRKDGAPRLLLPGKAGTLYLVALNGRVETVKLAGMPDISRMNVADINRDGADECLVSSGNRLSVYDLKGNLLWEKTFEFSDLGYPYVYRFSGADYRIGLTAGSERQMLLLTAQGELSEGFPVTGDSPFSIVFTGRDGFFLYAGADNGSFIKYKVQR